MLQAMGKNARRASRQLALASTAQKNACLERIVGCIWDERERVLEANRQDMDAAQAAGLSPAMIDRLMLNDSRLEGVLSDLRGVSRLPDPVGETFDEATLPNGLQVRKQRVPIGVLGVIYESRPNVTIDVSGLALKTGNAVILRGGSETIRSNQALVDIIRQAVDSSSLPADAVQLVGDPDRKWVKELLRMSDDIDMIIPRGGAALHKFCRENSSIPVITGGIGICHLYVDETADLDAALDVIENAKVQRPTVCNALDTLLVHRSVAADFLPHVVSRLAQDGVTFRADDMAQSILNQQPESVVFPAGPDDFDTEWLSLVLGLRVVDNLDQAVDHIAAHSTGHSDGILTGNQKHADKFVAQVDSAAVYVNASTRFTDGGQLGLGAEVAISTQRLHARGPMGLRELTTYKWVIIGDYHSRS